MSNNVMIVEDDPEMAEVVAYKLRQLGYVPRCFSSATECLAQLRHDECDVIVTDLKLPGMDGMELCRRMSELRSDVPVIVITAFGSLESAIEAIRAGAYDFVTKPIEMELLGLAVDRACKHRQLQSLVRRLDHSRQELARIDTLIGDSSAMQSVYDQVGRLASIDTTILVTGESGTGKELVARALHQHSPRDDGPFLAINCSALPEALLESELFGHEKGAFTDAGNARDGLFVQASGGTLFLDEIAELPLSLQPKLLRALEERRVRPVGGSEERSFDVRLIAATNRDLEAEIKAKNFRRDLFYRLNVVEISLPPLRVRGSDCLLLAQHFTRRFAERFEKAVTGISDSAARKLVLYDWPGNVRELRNAMEHAVAVTEFEKITVDDLPPRIGDHERTDLVVPGMDAAELVPLDEVERRYILHSLKMLGGNRSQAARILGLGRKTLYRKLQRYGISE